MKPRPGPAGEPRWTVRRRCDISFALSNLQNFSRTSPRGDLMHVLCRLALAALIGAFAAPAAAQNPQQPQAQPQEKKPEQPEQKPEEPPKYEETVIVSSSRMEQ